MKTFCANKIQNKKLWGRVSNFEEGIAFFWTASGIEVNAKAAELWAEIESDFSVHEVWIAIFVDGVQSARFMLNKGSNKFCVFRNMNPRVAKNVRIFKEVQAMPADNRHKMVLKNFLTDGSFEKVLDANLKIEFIGDSITSGEGACGAKIEEDWISMFFGGTKSYAFKLSQMLGAEISVLSQSGWGVVTSWDNNPQNALPKYYGQTCGVLCGEKNKKLGAAEKWNFSLWQPDVIIVNLGTNDNGAFFNPPSKLKDGSQFKMRLSADGTPEKNSASFFEKGVFDFLKTLREKNPKAKIFWCYGMMGQLLFLQFKNAFALYKKKSGDKNAKFILLPQIDVEKTAARSHPSEEQHKEVAEFLYKKIFKSKQSL